MVDESTLGSPDPLNDQDGAKYSATGNKICNRRIAHATIATVNNDRFTSLCTLVIRPEKKASKINPALIHKRIFDAIRVIDDTAAIITANHRIIHSKDIPTGTEYETTFPDIRTDPITKRMYLSFTLESTHTISQLKYGSKYDGTTGIFETLRENLAFIKLQNFQSLTEASIGFFLGINPKLTLRNVLKQKIDNICTWLDLDDDDTKALTKTTTTDTGTISQEIVIPAYDIYHKVFGSGTGNDRITTNVYEIRTSPEHAPILKSILYKASQPEHHPTVQFILYGIQGITNRDIYKTIIQKQNAFINDNSIIPIYDINEEDVAKFDKLIKNSKYIQDIEQTNESTHKGKYFLITTKTDYRKAVIEVNEMIKYVYPDRETKRPRERQQAPIIHTNVSTYAQTLMNFHEANPVPNSMSNKRLKIRLNDDTLSSKRNATLTDTTQILPPHEKTVTFIHINDPTPAENAAFTENINHLPTRNPNRPATTSGRSTIGGRGDDGRGSTSGRGGTNGRGYGRGYTQYQPTTPSGDWRDTVRDMMTNLQTNIMKEVQLSISAQIQELAMTLTTQVTNAIKEGLSIQPNNIPDTDINTEPKNDIELITQESEPPKEDITDMDLEVEPRKRKGRSTNKATDERTVITPTRLSRQAKSRSQEAALKKTQKIGQKTD